MFNLQGSEIIVILLLALVVLGPEKLPDAIRKFSRTYADFKKMSSGFQSELKSALDEPMREMRETAEMVRDAADPRKIADEADAEERLRRDAERVHPEPIDATFAEPTADAAPGPTPDIGPDTVPDHADAPDAPAVEPSAETTGRSIGNHTTDADDLAS